MVKYALLIGINYTGTEHQLYGCINDINNTRTFLQSQLGYTNFVVLTDNTPVKPTKSNIMNEIISLARRLKSGDEAWFHYSGHGILLRDRNGDEESGNDSCLTPLDYMRAGFISDDTIRSNLVQRVPPGAKLYVVLDACHSGTGCDLRFKYDDTSYLVNPSVKPLTYVPSEWALRQTSYEFKRYQRIAGEVYCISGSQDHQESGDTFIEKDQMYGGVLTSTMLFLLRSNDLNVYKWKHLLKDICCSERANGYTQITALTSGNPLNMENPVFVIPKKNVPPAPQPPRRNNFRIQSNQKNVNTSRGIFKKMIFM